METTLDELNLISMNVILHAGNARDFNMKILDELKKSDPSIELIDELHKKAKNEITIAHNKQTEMLQREANEDKIPFSVLFIHSQDTLMTIQSEVLMTEKLVPIVIRLGGNNHDQKD